MGIFYSRASCPEAFGILFFCFLECGLFRVLYQGNIENFEELMNGKANIFPKSEGIMADSWSSGYGILRKIINLL